MVHSTQQAHPTRSSQTSYSIVDDAVTDSAAPLYETSIILPAYNEAEALPHVLASLFRVVDERYEVIVVDDGSSDATAQIAQHFPCVLIQQLNQGKGAAVRAGMRAARGERIIIMDADNTYPAEAILPMNTLLEHNDLVRGNRAANTEHMPLINRCGNKIFDISLHVFYGLEGGDYLTGLYGLRRAALDLIDFTADGFDMEVEIGLLIRKSGLINFNYLKNKMTQP